MKKFFMMAVMAVCALAANAQTPAAGSFKVTPMVGVSIANLTGDFNQTIDTKVGFTAGAEGLYMIDDMFGISAGVMYSQQGGKDHGNSLSLDYVNIPIMANSYLAPGLAVKIGVQPGFKVRENWENSVLAIKGDAMESFDLSVPVGVSYEFSNVVLDARYNWGVTNVFKSDEAKAHNSVFQVTLGYRF